MANAARSAKDWRTAHRNYTVALKGFPSSASIWVQSGHAAKEMGDLAAAENAYQTASRLAPNDVDLQIQLGHLFKETGRLPEALSHYKTALTAGSVDAHAIDYVFCSAVAEADVASENGWTNRAIAFYREAANARPDFRVFLHMGDRLNELQDFEAARQAYLSALALRPEEPDALSRIRAIELPPELVQHSAAPYIVVDTRHHSDGIARNSNFAKVESPKTFALEDAALSEHAAFIREQLQRALMNRRV